MFSFPPLPDWQSLHPLVVHFPIALLLVAPLFLIIGVLRGAARGRPWLLAALLLMLLGTAGAWFAVATGKAASELVERNSQMNRVLEQHEELAELTRNVFTILTALFVVLLALPAMLRKERTRLASIGLPLLFLAAYAAGMLMLANTAHDGGKLVHELGSSAATVVSPGDEE